jgi:hypothetical protein
LACILDGTIIAFLKNYRRRDDKSEGVENVTCTHDGFLAAGLLPDLSLVHTVGRDALSALQPIPASAGGDLSPGGAKAETHHIARPTVENKLPDKGFLT